MPAEPEGRDLRPPARDVRGRGHPPRQGGHPVRQVRPDRRQLRQSRHGGAHRVASGRGQGGRGGGHGRRGAPGGAWRRWAEAPSSAPTTATASRCGIPSTTRRTPPTRSTWSSSSSSAEGFAAGKTRMREGGRLADVAPTVLQPHGDAQARRDDRPEPRPRVSGPPAQESGCPWPLRAACSHVCTTQRDHEALPPLRPADQGRHRRRRLAFGLGRLHPRPRRDHLHRPARPQGGDPGQVRPQAPTPSSARARPASGPSRWRASRAGSSPRPEGTVNPAHAHGRGRGGRHASSRS